MNIRIWRSSLLALCLGAGPALAQTVPNAMANSLQEPPQPIAVARQMGGWTFAPIVAGPEARIVAYIALQSKGEFIEGQIDVVWFERGVDGWTASTWVDGGLIDAVAYAHQRFATTRNHLAPAQIGDAWGKFLAAPYQAADPELLVYGVAQSDPMADVLADIDDLGDGLEELRQAGWAITPELPAIFARSQALMAGDRGLADQITQNAIITISPGGPSTPIDQCGVVVAYAIALTASSHENYKHGMQSMLSQIADLDQAMLDSGGRSPDLGMFCGCSVLYGACTGATGAYAFTNGNPSAGSTHCRYCKPGPGTQTYTYVGQTFWCCDPCTGGGTQSCTDCVTCTVPGLGTCPATPPC